MLGVKWLLSCLNNRLCGGRTHNNLNSLFCLICFCYFGICSLFSLISIQFAYIIDTACVVCVVYRGKYYRLQLRRLIFAQRQLQREGLLSETNTEFLFMHFLWVGVLCTVCSARAKWSDIWKGGFKYQPACRFINSYCLDPQLVDPFIFVIISVSVSLPISPTIPRL